MTRPTPPLQRSVHFKLADDENSRAGKTYPRPDRRRSRRRALERSCLRRHWLVHKVACRSIRGCSADDALGGAGRPILLEEERHPRAQTVVADCSDPGRIERAMLPCPDSPPAITQSMPARSRPSSGPISGSHERKRTAAAGTARRSATRAAAWQHAPRKRPSIGSAARRVCQRLSAAGLTFSLVPGKCALRGVSDHGEHLAHETERDPVRGNIAPSSSRTVR